MVDRHGQNMPGKNPLPTDRRERDAAPSEPRGNPPMESDAAASPLFGITRWEENLSTACFSATRGAGASAASRHDPLVACLTADTGRHIGLRQTALRSRLPSVAAAHAGALLPAAAAHSAARIRCFGPAQRPHATPYLPHSFCWMEEWRRSACSDLWSAHLAMLVRFRTSAIPPAARAGLSVPRK